MNLIFLGGIFSDGEKDIVLKKSRGGIQSAADTLQKNYISGFSQNALVKDIVVVNLPFVGSYPKRYTDFCYRPERSVGKFDRATLINVGFLNLAFVKNIHRVYLAVREVLGQLRQRQGQENYLVCYSMHLPFMLACYIIKRLRKDVHLCVIVPDLPEYMDARTGMMKLIFSAMARLSYYSVNKAESVVAITKPMLDKFKGNITKLVIEGIADPGYISLSEVVERKKYFLYTGTLDARYGIRNLLDSFVEAGSNEYELYICGDGNARGYVESVAASNGRVKYLGQLDRSSVLTLQRSASLLINPRDNDSEYTKYSFPSKIIEYMSSGVPVLMYRLDGIPQEYYDFCFLIRPGRGQLAASLRELSGLPEEVLVAKGAAAKRFIVESKMPAMQVSKLLSAIKGREHV